MSENIGVSDDRYLYCETLTGEWWYKDMETGEDLPLYSTPIRGREEVETFSRWQDPVIEDMQQEIERLQSIIKEVREYIEENMSYNTGVEIQYIPSGEELLEILDKGE